MNADRVIADLRELAELTGGERNWDYRYTWIRDSTFALWGLYTLGFDWEANDFFYFIADVAGGDHDLQIMYGIGGERLLEESVLDHLDGYEGAKPVRVGNGAYAHRQHDVWGTILDSFYLHTKSRDGLPDRFWPVAGALLVNLRNVLASLDVVADAQPVQVPAPALTAAHPSVRSRL